MKKNRKQLIDKVEAILAFTYRQRHPVYSSGDSWAKVVMGRIHQLEYNPEEQTDSIEKLVWRLGWAMTALAVIILIFSTINFVAMPSQTEDNFWNEMQEFADVTHFLVERGNGV